MNKTAFFYWDGPMPWLNSLTLLSFAKFNPDWKMVLWIGDNVAELHGLELMGVEIRRAKSLDLPKDTRPQTVADIYKWWSLSNEGGIASDMDIIYLKPIPDVCEVDIGLIEYGNGKTKRPIWTVGFCTGGPNKFYKKCFDLALKHVGGLKYQCSGSHILRALATRKDVTLFDSDLIYPMYKHMTERKMSHAVMMQYKEDFELPDISIGYHWYGGGRNSSRVASRIGPDYDEDTVIRRCINAVLRTT